MGAENGFGDGLLEGNGKVENGIKEILVSNDSFCPGESFGKT